MSEKILLIDGHSILNRAFYGLPDLTNTEGKHTGGGLRLSEPFCSGSWRKRNPDYLTVAFDLHEPTFRHKIYEAYKGTRKGMPEELREQVPLMKEMLGSHEGKNGFPRQDTRRTISWEPWPEEARNWEWT